MKKYDSHLGVDKYLPTKRIIILSLVVTMAYYFLFTLNHYFARPSFDNRETEQIPEKEVKVIDFRSEVLKEQELSQNADEPAGGTQARTKE